MKLEGGKRRGEGGRRVLCGVVKELVVVGEGKGRDKKGELGGLRAEVM